MRKDITCDKCFGTGRLTDKSLPFEVGDRVVGTMMDGKAGEVILPRLTGSVYSAEGNRYTCAVVYAVQWDDFTYSHMGEDVLEFEEK